TALEGLPSSPILIHTVIICIDPLNLPVSFSFSVTNSHSFLMVSHETIIFNRHHLEIVILVNLFNLHRLLICIRIIPVVIILPIIVMIIASVGCSSILIVSVILVSPVIALGK